MLTHRFNALPSASSSAWPVLPVLYCIERRPIMRITLSITNPEVEDQDLLTLEIFPDMPVSTLREAIQAETQILPTSQHLYHNGRLIQDDNSTMEQLQIADGEMLALHAKIEEMIRQERVMENLQNAMEHNPEVFGRVHMLRGGDPEGE
ncbi:hypothetical protein CGMCC3_g12891 [Colletotrichum fructicola]|nr:uncharacterized protein CGMCC3_g12891 [Colletotrichum fructicola]KAE9571045.1 hypothetical protein CGMCC3_g12891 [Colletotrichum fructicola]